jgi:putative transposase
MDNRHKFEAKLTSEWSKMHGIEFVCYIEPCKPKQNAFIERFNSSYCKQVPNVFVFDTLYEVRE